MVDVACRSPAILTLDPGTASQAFPSMQSGRDWVQEFRYLLFTGRISSTRQCRNVWIHSLGDVFGATFGTIIDNPGPVVVGMENV